MTPEFRPIVQAARETPAVSIDRLTGVGDVLVLAPHPDDESLGCGAAIAAAAHAGRRVHVVIVTDGCKSHPESRTYPAPRLSALRKVEARTAAALLTAGATRPIFLAYPDQGAPDDPASMARIAGRLAPLLPGVTAIWAAWEGDPHPDHRRSWTIARHLAAKCPSARLLAYPVWGRVQGEAMATGRLLRFPAGRWRALKARAVAAYRSQMTRLINDDPGGFMMPPPLRRHFVDHDEIFIDPVP